MSIRIIQGDCVAVMATLPECSVDAVVTDPPYGIRFMGKAWDGADIEKRFEEANTDPARRRRTGAAAAAAAGKYDLAPTAMLAFQRFSADWAREAFRVLKPGGHLLCFASTRTYHRMACGVEEAGFEIRDQIGWLFGSGFPKSLDVSKAIDSRKDWAALHALQGKVRAAREALGLSQSEAARRMGLIGPGETLGGGGFMWFETGMRVPTREQYPALKAALGLDDGCDLAFEAAEREVVGQHRASAGGQNMRAGIGGGDAALPPGHITAPGSAAAAQWEGWGTALKPAWEPIVLARKPLAGTVAQNVLQHGTGALNIDGCRVACDDVLVAPKSDPSKRKGVVGEAWQATGDAARNQAAQAAPIARTMELGRWPANLIHDGSDEVLAAFPQAPGAKADVAGDEPSDKTTDIFNTFSARTPAPARADGGGSAARFFYTAKTSRAERNEGLEDTGPQFRSGRTPRDAERVEAQKRGNHHPTVKPVDLMRYLCRLITPPGGIVLDPFCGSGSTLKAAELEGFSAIGIELDPAYVEIARRRIAADAPLFADVQVEQ